MLKRSDLELRLGVEHEVDKRVLYLYELILKGKPPFSLNDNEKIRAKLVEYMSTMPLLTAPIKNTETPELYKIIRSIPIERWE